MKGQFNNLDMRHYRFQRTSNHNDAQWYFPDPDKGDSFVGWICVIVTVAMVLLVVLA